MTIEQSLAAQQIVKMLRAGYSKEVAIVQATKFVKSQGFSSAHAKKTAIEMAEVF